MDGTNSGGASAAKRKMPAEYRRNQSTGVADSATAAAPVNPPQHNDNKNNKTKQNKNRDDHGIQNQHQKRPRRKANPFSQAVATYGHLLVHNYDKDMENRRGRCMKIILDALLETLLHSEENIDQISLIRLQDLQRVLCRCLQIGGKDNHGKIVTATRIQVLTVLEKTTHVTAEACPAIHDIRTILLQFLPMTVSEQEEEVMVSPHFIKLFRKLLVNPPREMAAIQQQKLKLMIPVLKMLAAVPLTEEAEHEIICFIHKTLANITFIQRIYPDLVDSLLEFSITEEQILASLGRIRDSWYELQKQDPQSAPASPILYLFLRTLNVLQLLSDPDSLASASAAEDSPDIPTLYFKCLECTWWQEGSKYSALDLAFLLFVQKQRRQLQSHVDESMDEDGENPPLPDPTTRIINCWIETKCFPFDALQWICSAVLNAEATLHSETRGEISLDIVLEDLLYSLADLALHLVAQVDWGICQRNMLDETLKFVGNLYTGMNARQRDNLSTAFLNIWKSALHIDAEIKTSEDAQEKCNEPTHSTIIQVGRVLRALAQRHSPIIVEATNLFEAVVTASDQESSFPGYDAALVTSCVVVAYLQTDLVTLIQKLLFSGDGRSAGWTFRGLLLATERIRSGLATDSEKDSIKKSVLEIILPSSRRMIDPELGPHCLAFLQVWRDNENHPSDVFKVFQVLLSNTGLIQLRSNYENQSKSRKHKAFLGFSRPRHSPSSDQSGNARSMVFCVAYFLRSMQPRSAMQFAATAKWVFELVDAYIEIGRERTTATWEAPTWLDAAIELPKFRPIVGKAPTQDARAAVDWLEQEFVSFELSPQIGTEAGANLLLQFVELLSQEEAVTNVKDLISSLSEMSLAMLVAASASAAVVKNAFAHYRSMEKNKEEQETLLQHICHHLRKVNLIRTKCKSMGVVLDCLGKAMSRLLKPEVQTTPGKGPKPKRSLVKSDDFVQKLDHILSLRDCLVKTESEIFSSPKYFGRDVLWECLNNDQHDELLKQRLRTHPTKVTPTSSESFTLAEVLDFKQRLLEQLLLCPAPIAHIDNHVYRCIKAALSFIEMLPELKDSVGSILSGRSVMSVSQLSISYLNLSLATITPELYPGDKGAQISSGDLIQRLLISHGDTDLVSQVLELIRSSGDVRVASLLLELVSHFFPHKDADMLDGLVKISFQMLHTPYAQSGIENAYNMIPFSVRSIGPSLKMPASSLQVACKVLRQTVAKRCDARGSKLGQTLELQRSLLLRHFGLVYHSTGRRELFKNHTNLFVSELISLVSRLSDRSNDRGTSLETSTKSDSSEKKAGRRTVTICCLSPSTFPAYFETMLQIAVGAFAVFSPEKSDPLISCSPYGSLADAASLFQVLIKTYADNLALFPRKTTTAVLQISRLMLDALSYQINDCVLWRNSQRVATLPARQDLGSVSNLSDFIDVVASCICGSLYYLCKRWIDQEEISNIAQKGESLCCAVDKASNLLTDVASAHKLGCPRFDMGSKKKISQAPGAHPKEGKMLLVPRRKRRWPCQYEESDVTTRSPKRLLQREFTLSEKNDGSPPTKKRATLLIQSGSLKPPREEDDDEQFEVLGGWGSRSSAHDSSPETQIVQIHRSL